MSGDDDLRALIYETKQGVAVLVQDNRWIKETLTEIKDANKAQDERILAQDKLIAEIKTRQDQQTGKDSKIAAGISTLISVAGALLAKGGFP